MDRGKEFTKNTIILFVGKFATQFISLLLLPLFTRYLLTEDYGIIDLLQTYITLFVPILTLRIDSAVFRFLIDKRENEEEKKRILSNITFLLFIGIIFTTSLFAVIFKLMNVKYLIYAIVNLLILMVSSVFLQMLRGLGKNKEYSIGSIITGTITLVMNVVFIVFLSKGAESILIASSVANFVCILYCLFTVKLYKYVKVRAINKKEIKEILYYSLPMIPNALSWWVINASDRTIISSFLGVAFNGIYTVSCKFSNILNSIFSVFNMSWQETASLHVDDEDRDLFFTNIINKLLIFFSSISLLIVGFLPFVYNILIGEGYMDSYKYIPILLYANSWSVLISLIGGIYVAKKKTKQIASTTIWSAILNILINVLLIKYIGLYAACISTLLSYMIVGVYRYIDCQKYVKLKLDKRIFILFTVVFMTSTIMYLKNNMIINVLNLILVSSFSLFFNKDIIRKIISKITAKETAK